MQFRLHLSQPPPPPPPLKPLYETPGNLGHSERLPQAKKNPR